AAPGGAPSTTATLTRCPSGAAGSRPCSPRRRTAPSWTARAGRARPARTSRRSRTRAGQARPQTPRCQPSPATLTAPARPPRTTMFRTQRHRTAPRPSAWVLHTTRLVLCLPIIVMEKLRLKVTRVYYFLNEGVLCLKTIHIISNRYVLIKKTIKN
ncbi:hypothetical protein EGW08_022308, partial [Elysia chlorotica]